MSATRGLVWILVACLAACTSRSSSVTRAANTFVISWVNDGPGPHIHWEMADYDLNKVSVKFSQRNPPFTDLSGEISVDPDYLENIRKVAREQRFLELRDIVPRVVDHLKQVTLRLTIDGHSHEVWVMDTESVADRDDYRRFELVEKAIFDPLPVGPGKTL